MVWLFNIFSLLYLVRGLQLVNLIRREWQSLTQEPLTAWKREMAEQAAFFVAVPPGVVIHEFGHTLAIWLFGGQVMEFGYRIFWGYVIPRGNFNPEQDWFISLAGTLGSLAYGLGVWLLLRRHQASALRYFGLRAFRFQVYFSLVYYPIFTLFLPVGDWRSIYNFQEVPLLAGLTAIAHIALLGLFWWGDRTGWFEMPSYDSTAEKEKATMIAQQAASQPQNPYLQLQYIDTLRRGGTTNKAKHQLKRFLQQHPNSADAYLQLAALESETGRHISRAARDHAQKALQLGLSNPHGVAFAHQLLGRYNLDIGNSQSAVNHLSQAINSSIDAAAANDSEAGSHLHRARLHHWRSQAYRQQQSYDAACQDILEAISLAQAIGDTRMVAFYQDELALAENHAGRKAGTKTPPTRPL